MSKWTRGLGAFVFASLLILAGCGGNTEETSNESNNDENNGNNKEETYNVGISIFVDHPSLNAATDGFKAALEESDLTIEYTEQNAQADMNTAKTIAQNLVNNNVDLIFANATPSAQAAASETNEIPIVFTSVTDPVGAELVASMEEPGENITGTADMHPDAIPNTIKFIKEEMDATTIGTIYNAGEQNSVAQVNMMKEAAGNTDLTIEEAVVANSSEVNQAVNSLIGKVDVIYIITDNTVVSSLETVISAAQENDIPLFVGELDSVDRGGFAAYGFNYYDIGYEAGQLAIQILKDGKSPSEIPAQYPQNLKLVINKQAAEEMGIELKPEWDDIAEYVE